MNRKGPKSSVDFKDSLVFQRKVADMLAIELKALQADFERSLHASSETTNKLNAHIAKLQAKCDDYEKALEYYGHGYGTPTNFGTTSEDVSNVKHKTGHTMLSGKMAREVLAKHKVVG